HPHASPPFPPRRPSDLGSIPPRDLKSRHLPNLCPRDLTNLLIPRARQILEPMFTTCRITVLASNAASSFELFPNFGSGMASLPVDRKSTRLNSSHGSIS